METKFGKGSATAAIEAFKSAASKGGAVETGALLEAAESLRDALADLRECHMVPALPSPGLTARVDALIGPP